MNLRYFFVQKINEVRTKEKEIYIGDKVICIVSGVTGIVVKKYTPTASEEQTMIRCIDGIVMLKVFI